MQYPARSRQDASVRALALAAPYPVLLMHADGTVAEYNAPAEALFPRVVPGSPASDVLPVWLAEAAAAESDGAVHGRIGQRPYTVRTAPVGDGSTALWLVGESEDRPAADELARERRHTRFLVEASEALFSTLNPGRCMEVAAQLAARYLADAAVVISPGDGRRLPVAMCDAAGRVTRRTETAVPEQVPGLAEALRGFPPVPFRWIDPELADWLLPEGADGVKAVALVPLPGQGVPAGALVLLRATGEAEFSEGEEETAALFAQWAGAAMSAARLYAEQASITDVLMRELLPPVLGEADGLELASRYRPAGDSERVGGDFYDVHHTVGSEAVPGGTLVALGDVCGKGLEAAVLTGKIRNTLGALLPLAADHQRMLTMLNQALTGTHHSRFATLVLASAEPAEGGLRLRLTSAGHLAPLLVRRDGTVEEARTRGTLMGVLPQIESETDEVLLAPGETCLLYTDGITEAKGGPMGDSRFGEERLRRALAECAGLPAEVVVERVHMLAAEWVGEDEHDDMALIALTAPRRPEPAAASPDLEGDA
ncbi:hypothetical protein GCM10012287_16500 [Streptomyces daqingensis]|uniref:PPM-type phosphatase domain-containing protein n=2 Tax=Streptomyces daqingensis TaxID=1472640 RepID=A0ABQ2M3C8_9ACTN|nr:hypothetical protein GCM10012287_16500 [Streptomyces daqingensis]